MIKDLLGAMLLIVIAVLMIPAAIALFVWTCMYGAILLPVSVLCFMIWRAIKRKGWIPNTVVPEYATPIKPRVIRKPIMIKWQDKDIPLGVFIGSIISSVVMLPILILLMLFLVPPMWTALIIGFMLAKKTGTVVMNRRKAC